MGFLQDNIKTSVPDELAHQLKQVLQSSGRLQKWSLSRWSNDFRLLVQSYSHQDVKRVLDWYGLHIKEPYVPRVHSAAGFRRNFPRLLERAKPSTVRPSETAIQLSKKLGRIWPNDEKEDELVFIEVSLQNYQKWLDWLKLQTDNSDRWLRSLANHLWETRDAPIHFVEWWTRDVHRLAWEWDQWNGKLMSFVFKPESDHFQKLMVEKTIHYCGESSRWRKLNESRKA